MKHGHKLPEGDMSPDDEGLIHAWLDGQLPADEAARVASLVETDPAWGAAAAEARGLIAASARILGALDQVPAVRPAVVPSATRTVRAWYAAPWLKAAAGFVVVAGVASVVWQRTPDAVREPTTEVAAVTDAADTTRALVDTSVVAVTPESLRAAGATAGAATREITRATAARAAQSTVVPPPPASTPPAAPPTTAKAQDVRVAEPPTVTTADRAAEQRVATGVAAGVAAGAASGGRGGAAQQNAAVSRAVALPLVERGTVGSSVQAFAPVPSSCWYPVSETGVADSAGVVLLSALSVAQDSVVSTRWISIGVAYLFTGRLSGDTLQGRVRESAGDIRRLPRDIKLVRGECRNR
jgi:hypothetical protein